MEGWGCDKSQVMLQKELDIYDKFHSDSNARKYVVKILLSFKQWSPDGSPGFLALVTKQAKRSLADWVAKAKPEKKELHKLSIARQLGMIVSYIHQQHLVWLDVKPANFLVYEDLVIKASDFDGAGEVGTAVTHKTVAYCAPELLGSVGVNATYEMDAWSLGMTIFEVFTGEHLYSLLGCRSNEQIERFWSTEGSEETLRSKASKQLTSSLSDQNLKRLLFGRDGNGGVLRADPLQRSSVL
eukprot:762983-Hanusia_phi.AAC.1